MSAGDKTRLVQIQQLAESKAESGMPRADWTPLVHVFASKDDTNGRERFTANQVSSPCDSVFEIPYLAAMDPEAINVPKLRRIVYLGRVYDIQAAKLIGWHRFIRLETLSGGTVR